jgi:hypothetical protein
MWNVRCWLVRFWSVTTKDRCRVGERRLDVLRRADQQPSVIRLL